MDVLQKLGRNAQKVSLEGRNITQLKPFVTVLSQFTSLVSLNLSRNKIKELPTEFANLTLQELDLIQNPISVVSVCQSLKSMITLHTLKLSLKSEEKAFVLKRLPWLKKLNDQEHQNNFSEKCWLDSDFLRKSDRLFALVYDLYKVQPTAENQQEIQQEYVHHLQMVKRKLVENNSSLQDSLTAGMNLVKSKYSLVEESFNLVLRHIQFKSDKNLQIFSEIHNLYAEIFQEMVFLPRLRSVSPTSGPKTAQSFDYTLQILRQQIERLKEDAQIQQSHVKQVQDQNRQYRELIIKHGMQKDPNSDVKVVAHQFIGKRGGQPEISISGRTITLRVLKEQIAELLAQRAKSERSESLQNFMYTFLQKKYGLKQLVIQWMVAITEGLKTFSKDTQIAFFISMLRHQVEEDFLLVQNQLKNTFKELILLRIKAKRPKLSNEQLLAYFNQLKLTPFSKDQLCQIVQYIYNEPDSKTVLRSIGDQSVNYDRLLSALLQFQIQSHKKYLSKFNMLFKRHDRDEDGVLQFSETLRIVRMISPSFTEQQLKKAILKVKANKELGLTLSYSQCVALFSTQRGKQEYTLLTLLNQRNL